MSIFCLSCSFFPNTQWSEPKKKSSSSILTNSYELDNITKSYHENHKELLDYLAEKEKTTNNWTLSKLGFSHDETLNNSTIFLSAIFQSRGRYNTKFTTYRERKVSEWEQNGKKFLNAWILPLQSLKDKEIGIKLLVQYKHKNYLRPNRKLVRGSLPIIILPTDLKKTGANPEKLYKLILGQLKKAKEKS